MALAFEGSSKLNASIGNYFSLFGIRSEENADWFFHVGLEGAGYFTMRQADHRFPLETADGLLGAYVETSVGPFQYQFRLTHISAHLADGSTGSGDGSAIPYSRETAILRFGYLLNPEVHFYSGLQYIVHTIPELPRWGFQLGSSAFFPVSGWKMMPFGAFDLQQKEDRTVNPSLSIQFGLAVGNTPEVFKSFRFFYAYFTGADPRGQFFDQSVTTHSLGIEMQI
jgi:Protein of unknown function (DUF1207)